MHRTGFIYALLIWVLSALVATARPAVEKILPLDAEIAGDGRSIILSWFDADPPRVGSVMVKRRLYGQLGGGSWQVIAEALGPVMRHTDDTIKPGVAYEYQVLRTARDIVDVGYWLGGTDLPARDRRGHAYVIVDESLSAALATRLARFERDLIGDGWAVQRHDVPRGNGQKPVETLKIALALKKWLSERYNQDPFGEHAIILVGHVPVLKSGKVNPDGHAPTPHPTDLFYADMDGRWSVLRNGEMLDHRVPGDFIEMQIGRIDFAPVSDGDRETEIHLLRSYFDKNHHWRMGYLGDLREAYGNAGHLAVEQAALRNVVGPGNISIGGHHDVGEEKPWLWGIDFGDRKGELYAEKYANKAIFALNFGSGKQKMDNRFNAMTALLAQSWYPVAVGWGGRPAWWLHHMALGGSIGDAHKRTVNNGRAAEPYRESMDYYPTGRYLIRNGIWINLLGDPTLRAFPLAPPRELRAAQTAINVTLTWKASPDPDTQGYHVYRATPDRAGFTRLTGPDPITALEFTDEFTVDETLYMVRAFGMKTVHAGSFFTQSQGVFSAQSPLPEMKIDFAAAAGDAIPLPPVFDAPAEGRIHAIIASPAEGRLLHDGTHWIYRPPGGFAGTVDLPLSVSTRWRSRAGVLRLSVSSAPEVRGADLSQPESVDADRSASPPASLK